MRATAGYTRADRKRNAEILGELQVEPILQSVKQWKYVRRMSTQKVSQMSRQGRPRKKLIEDTDRLVSGTDDVR